MKSEDEEKYMKGSMQFDSYYKNIDSKFHEVKKEIHEMPKDINLFKNHQLPLARIKKIMKSDEDVRVFFL